MGENRIKLGAMFDFQPSRLVMSICPDVPSLKDQFQFKTA